MQDRAFSYTEILKMRSNFIVKIVFKWIKHEIMILWCECSFFNEKEIKSTKIVKIMNIKIEDNDKKNDNSKKISQQKHYAHIEFNWDENLYDEENKLNICSKIKNSCD